MSLKINLKKMAYTKFFCIVLLLLSCQSVNRTSLNNKQFKNLEDYKRITAYIIDKNYHYGFTKIDNYWISHSPDSVVSNFIREKKLVGIYINYQRDSVIEYLSHPIPVFGKRKSLIFDFSSNLPTENYRKNGVKQIVIEKGIYYIEY